MKNTIEKNAFIGKQAKITGSAIGASSIVEGIVENSTIGRGCYIDKNSRIIHSTIGDYSQIYNSELTCVNTGTLFEAEDAKIFNASFGQNNTVYGEIKPTSLKRSRQETFNIFQAGANILEEVKSFWHTFFQKGVWAGDNNLFKKTCVLEGKQNIVGSNTIIDGRIINSFIGDGTKIHHSGAVIENSCIAPYRRLTKHLKHGQTSLSMPPSEHGKEECFTVDIFDAWVSQSVIWGGSDISPGVNIRANSIIGPFVHVGTGGETKAAFIRGGSALNKVEAAHRNYLGNFLAYVIRIDSPINSPAYYKELQEKMEALLYGTILARKINQLVEDPIQPEEELVIDYKGKKITVVIEGINLGALFTTSNFDPRNDGIKGITIVKSGAKAGICSGAQAPVVIETKALIGSMSKTFGRQTSHGDIVVGGVPETIKRGVIISQRGRLGDRVKENIEINLDGLRQLNALVNVSIAGINKATESLTRATPSGTEFRHRLDKRDEFPEIIGNSKKMQAVFDLILKVADSNVTVLILGESGTGKELVAKAIHEKSRRRNHPLIHVNCAVIPETLLESELFGYEKGSFTGTDAQKQGLFEVANKGTICLDEIGEMGSSLQVKLLRILETGMLWPVGASQGKKIDVRVIAITNQNLKEKVLMKEFREDLFHRLNAFPISLPPLRERKNDIPPLVCWFLEKNEYEGKKVGIAPEALKVLTNTSYSWPGNVRELRNVIERAIILSHDNEITIDLLPPEIRTSDSSRCSYVELYDKPSKEAKLELERQYIEKLLAYRTEIAILKAQIEELAGWTLRLLKLTEISVRNLKKDLKEFPDPATIERRIKEQNEVLARSHAIKKELMVLKTGFVRDSLFFEKSK